MISTSATLCKSTIHREDQNAIFVLLELNFFQIPWNYLQIWVPFRLIQSDLELDYTQYTPGFPLPLLFCLDALSVKNVDFKKNYGQDLYRDNLVSKDG